LSWFKKICIFDTISFNPNQIKSLAPNIKENKGLISLFFYDKIPFGFFPKNLDFNSFVHLNTMAVSIFDDKFMDNLECFNLKTTSNIPLTRFYLIHDKIGAWYEYIEKQDIWSNRKLWTCKIWVVEIVLKLLLNLVAEKIISERK
jgi:hypothetical protein